MFLKYPHQEWAHLKYISEVALIGSTTLDVGYRVQEAIRDAFNICACTNEWMTISFIKVWKIRKGIITEDREKKELYLLLMLLGSLLIKPSSGIYVPGIHSRYWTTRDKTFGYSRPLVFTGSI